MFQILNHKEKPMLEAGYVSKVEGQMVHLDFERSSMCDKCGACEMNEHGMHLEVRNTVDAKVGDYLIVSLSGRKILTASLLVYGVPLIFLLLGLYLGSMLPALLRNTWNPDLCAAACGILSCALVFVILRLLEPHMARKGSFSPQILSVMTEEEVLRFKEKADK